MKRIKKLIMTLVPAVVLGLAATAQAQDTPPPSETPPPAPAAHHSSSGGAGIGVGAMISLAGFPAAQFVYDQDMWHLEGLFALDSTTAMGPMGTERATHVTFGAGGWYHMHRGASSDFSLGVALVVDNNSPAGGGPSNTLTSVEPGAMARVFVTPNVAVHGRLGLAMLLGDTGGGGTDFSLGGQFTGLFGFTYFFR
jgi:hypothetical protein